MTKRPLTKTEQIKLLQEDVNAWNVWREAHTRPYVKKGILVDLSGANLSEANLSNANLRFVKLDGSEFVASILIRTDLSEASLVGANLQNANLYEANLSFANLKSALFNHQTNLSGANLHRADFAECDLGKASLKQSWKLESKNLNGAKNVLKSDLKAWLEHRDFDEEGGKIVIKAATTTKVVNKDHIRIRRVLVTYNADLEEAITSIKSILDSHVPAEEWTPECNADRINLSRKDFNTLEKLVFSTNEWLSEDNSEDIILALLDNLHQKIKAIRPYSNKVGAIVGELGNVGKELTGIDRMLIKSGQTLERIISTIRSQDTD